ncbi:MAG: hypothetical protein DHS20C17_33660 [Cyclobacteriaceae bacterium]|nr:MAG: hypothetical protein DHS20C17_33660 [Cyclobacteriaceae bacterium]
MAFKSYSLNSLTSLDSDNSIFIKGKLKLLLITIALIGFGCNQDQSNISADSGGVTTLPDNTATPPKEWIEQRVSNAQNRLPTTDAGQLIWKSIEAHGGLYRWFSNGPLYFRFNYQNLESGGPDTYQTVDTWSSKARHQLVADTSIEYGWDGEKAWKYPYDAEIEENPRFWALTPFYFTAVPFVLADEGIGLEYKGIIEFENNKYHQILTTFKEGMGDSPDDFYVLYIDTNTFRVGGLRYIVSYPGYYDKGEHGAERHMTYYGEQTVDGILFPESIKTYSWDGEAPTEHTTNITISEIAFRPETTPDYFNVPEGSRVMEGYNF